ncbi:MAG TPA: hypothetical protein ENK28_04705 [Aliiroseovarius sp.]|nr:hypothetical protein [Aliiroseovarius sp.]
MEDQVLTDLRAKYPLPDGVSDAVVNRAQLAVALAVSENTITKYMSQADGGMPVLSVGGNGREYEFQLADCYAWRMARDEEARRQKAAGDQAALQLALAFRNDDEALVNSGERVLSAKDIRAESEADLQRNKAAELRGELVRASRVREAFEDMMVAFRITITTVVDYSEMEFGLTPEQVEKLQRRCDAVLVQARTELSKVMGNNGQGRVAVLSRPGSDQGDLSV